MSSNGPYTISGASKEVGNHKISLRQRLGRWLLKDKNREHLDQLHPVAVSSSDTFSHDFAGWYIRIHKATNGHIVEVWRNNESSYPTNGRREREHEMFLVSNNDDLLQELPNILTNIMLKG